MSRENYRIKLPECPERTFSVSATNPNQATMAARAILRGEQERAKNEPRVLVEVSGGVASVSADNGVRVHLVDYDNKPDAEIPAEFNRFDQPYDRDIV